MISERQTGEGKRKIIATALAKLFERKEDAHGCKVFAVDFDEGDIPTVEDAFVVKRDNIIKKVKTELRKQKIVKFGTVLIGNFSISGEDGKIEKQSQIPLRSVHSKLFLSDEKRIPSLVNSCMRQTLDRVSDLEETGSGWTLDSIAELRLEVGKCSLIGAGASSGFDLNKIKGNEHLIDVKIDGN